MRGFAAAIFFATIVACAVNFASSDDSSSSSEVRSALIPCKRSAGKANDGNVRYDWKYDDDDASWLSDVARFKGRVAVALNGDLLINRFTSRDHGRYTCHVRRSGSTVDKVSVRVDDKYRLPVENCHPSGCIKARKCSSPRNTNSCPDEGEVCCATVRDQDRYLCRHFLGECMRSCNSQLLRKDATDCKAGTQCCVLV